MAALDISALQPKSSPLRLSFTPGPEMLSKHWSRFRSLTWLRAGLSRSEAVARVETSAEDGLGTGCLLPGASLHPNLPHTVFVTNAHVIPEALEAYDAIVSFYGLADPVPRTSFRIVRTTCSSTTTRRHFSTPVPRTREVPGAQSSTTAGNSSASTTVAACPCRGSTAPLGLTRQEPELAFTR
jgi:hypothetical protein